MVRCVIIHRSYECVVERPAFLRGCPVYSGAFICPVCLEIWAKILVEGQSSFECRGVPCENHPQACHPILRPVAGSILDNPTCNGWDTDLLEALPPEVLRHELSLHIKAFDNEQILLDPP